MRDPRFLDLGVGKRGLYERKWWRRHELGARAVAEEGPGKAAGCDSVSLRTWTER